MSERDEYISRAEDRLRAFFLDRERFTRLVKAGAEFSKTYNIEDRITLLSIEEMPLISEQTFEALLCGGESYAMMLTHEIWNILVSKGIFVKTLVSSHGDGLLADHQIFQHKLAQHLNDGTFLNLFHPASMLHARYAPSVVAVNVENKNGDLTRGSAFIIRFAYTSDRWLITCKHNVDPAEGIKVHSFESADGKIIDVEEAYLSNRYDLAVYRVASEVSDVTLSLCDQGNVFDEVYTLGFPQVPGAEPLLLGHRGEINGRANLYVQRCEALIISNLVSPGSSGCPVLNRDGRCVGMTIDWLEGEWGQNGEQKARFSAALPASVIMDEVKALQPVTS